MKEPTNRIKDPEFRIPQGYFESLGERVEARIAAGKTRPGRTIRMRILRWSAAAAVVAALALGAELFFRTGAQTDTQIMMTGEEARTFAAEYLAAFGDSPADEEPRTDPSLDDFLNTTDTEIIYVEQNNIYAVNRTAIEQYITDHYNLMELATL